MSEQSEKRLVNNYHDALRGQDVLKRRVQELKQENAKLREEVDVMHEGREKSEASWESKLKDAEERLARLNAFATVEMETAQREAGAAETLGRKREAERLTYREEAFRRIVLALAASALPEKPPAQPWACGARKQGTAGGNDPADCDWPVCGCDPYANMVIEALMESGALPEKPRELPEHGPGKCPDNCPVCWACT